MTKIRVTQVLFTWARLTGLAGLPGAILPWVRMRNFSPVFERPKTSCGAQFEVHSLHGETQSYDFRAYYSFGNSYSCVTVAKWNNYDVENTAGKARRCRIHPAFITVTGLKGNKEKFSSPLQLPTEFPVRKTETSGTEPARPLIWTYRKIYEGLRGNARPRKPGQPGQPKPYEETVKTLGDVGSQERLRRSEDQKSES